MNIIDFYKLANNIKFWGKKLGFNQIGITDTNLTTYKPYFKKSIEQKSYNQLKYLTKNFTKRIYPEELFLSTKSIIVAKINYLPFKKTKIKYISRYALGLDYHKVIYDKLKLLAVKITSEIGTFNYKIFSDSAPVLEKPLAEKAGLGWQGKHSILLDKNGSYFFIGEIYTDLPLPIDQPIKPACGTCSACINICPTQAIISPKCIDISRCISYLTIEYKDIIPINLRKKIGNKIYGCDDCQIICPWNKFAIVTKESAFKMRQDFKSLNLLNLFSWTEEEFLQKTKNSVIRRIGYKCWLRNIAIALGNEPYNKNIIIALTQKLSSPLHLVNQHVIWALEEQHKKSCF